MTGIGGPGGVVLDALAVFVGLFPMLVAMLAIDSSRRFALDRRGISTARVEPQRTDWEAARATWPEVAVVIPARDEEGTIAAAVRSALALRWPSVRVVVVDDGSVDATAVEVEAIGDPRVELLRRPEPGGKSAALDLAIGRIGTEVVLILDADARPEIDVLDLLVPQLLHHTDVGAVTADPRVADTSTLLGVLQAIEFSGTVSALRRGQASWGRVCTMSGVCTLLRREAVEAVGGFATDMHAEDIELSWRLQLAGWRVEYEPDALVAMHVPTTWRSWVRQRRRWATGLVEALRRHARSILRRENRFMWPIALEAGLSIFWCHLLVFFTALWLVGTVVEGPVGLSPVPARWGALSLVVALAQILWGAHLDAKKDPAIRSTWWAAPLYPLLYWWASSGIVVLTTVPTLLRRDRRVTWEPDREPLRT